MCFAARDWGAMAEIVADGTYADDRRRVVNSGIRHGRDAAIANMQAIAEVGTQKIRSTAIATRGGRLALCRTRLSGRNQGPEAFHTEGLIVLEIDADNRIVARIVFDPDNIDAAFAELDARYLAGEAAAHAHTWSLVKEAYAAFNRREFPPTTPDWANIDRRRGAGFAPGDALPYVRAAWEVAPDVNIYIEAVHRLSNLGAVVTYAAKGKSRAGFDAEWREITLLTFAGDAISRCEIFDEMDLDAAVARFDELDRPVPKLENAATPVLTRVMDAFNRRDLDSFLAVVTADGRYEDRRKGLRDEGPIKPGFARTLFFESATSWQEEIEPIAVRGPRLVVCRVMFRDHSEVDRPIAVEALVLTEVTDDELISRFVVFDPDDINGAMAELTARWIASGEVAHPEVIETARRLNEAVNRDDWEAFATLNADATFVDHRQLSSPGVETIADQMSSIRTMASLVPDYWVELAEVLTYSARGLVGDVFLRGTVTDGLAIEIPLVMLLVVDRDRVTGFEAFDPDQRDLALARFEELSVKDQPK